MLHIIFNIEHVCIKKLIIIYINDVLMCNLTILICILNLLDALK